MTPPQAPTTAELVEEYGRARHGDGLNSIENSSLSRDAEAALHQRVREMQEREMAMRKVLDRVFHRAFPHDVCMSGVPQWGNINRSQANKAYEEYRRLEREMSERQAGG